MPGQLLFQPNPPPDPSQLPDSILQYGVQLDISNTLSSEELAAIKQFRRAADYIAAGMRHQPSLHPYTERWRFSDDLPKGQRPR